MIVQQSKSIPILISSLSSTINLGDDELDMVMVSLGPSKRRSLGFYKNNMKNEKYVLKTLDKITIILLKKLTYNEAK